MFLARIGSLREITTDPRRTVTGQSFGGPRMITRSLSAEVILIWNRGVTLDDCSALLMPAPRRRFMTEGETQLFVTLGWTGSRRQSRGRTRRSGHAMIDAQSVLS